MEEINRNDICLPDTEVKFKPINPEIIKEAIVEVFKINPLIRKDTVLIKTVFAILNDFYVEGKKAVILEAPTGIGKSVIGYLVIFSMIYIENKLDGNIQIIKDGTLPYNDTIAYLLTSSKILQEQIDGDRIRFNYEDYLYILKGVSNYECPKGTFMNKTANINDICYYPDRPCIGMKKDERENFCTFNCPYMDARETTSRITGAVFNYSYFLNIFRSEFNPFFGVRKLTICDEAHLLPEIVCNQFNYELTQAMVYRLWKLTNEILNQFGNREIEYFVTENKESLNSENKDSDELSQPETIRVRKTISLDSIILLLDKLRDFYYRPLTKFSEVTVYIRQLTTIYEDCSKFAKNWNDANFVEYFKKKYLRACEVIENFLVQSNEIFELSKRPEDIYFTSEKISKDDINGRYLYKHIIKDLSETELVKNHFLKFTDKVLLMSATIGNCDEFAKLIGLEDNTYSSWRLDSPFNFDKSPIYRCNSGNLKYDKFDNNIDKVLSDCLYICDELHPKEKGIIHTSTFKVQKLLMEELGKRRILTSLDFQNNPDLWKGMKNIPRFLIYNTSEEKEKFINIIKTEDYPYIIIGPSLYEGIDLKDDMGRFNILIKVPYAGLDDYIREKMKRYPFWYKRNTLQKITQAIGRTNRSVNDYSSVYLLDNCFEMLIWELPEYIINRLRKYYLK